MGPGAWKGAKKAIEDAPGNVIYSTKTRLCPQTEDKGTITAAPYLKLLVLVVVIAAVLVGFFCMKFDRFRIFRLIFTH